MNTDPEGREGLKDFGARSVIETSDKDTQSVDRYAWKAKPDVSSDDSLNE